MAVKLSCGAQVTRVLFGQEKEKQVQLNVKPKFMYIIYISVYNNIHVAGVGYTEKIGTTVIWARSGFTGCVANRDLAVPSARKIFEKTLLELSQLTLLKYTNYLSLLILVSCNLIVWRNEPNTNNVVDRYNIYSNMQCYNYLII